MSLARFAVHFCFSVASPSEKDANQLLEDDTSERAYLGDSETSSCGSEKERGEDDDQFEARFSKGTSSI